MIDGFAVDLGGTKTAVARIVGGKVTDRLQLPTDGQAGLADQIVFMDDLLDQLGFVRGLRLGVATAGRITSEGTWQAVNAAILPGITGVPLLDQLRARFGENVTAVNDAAAAALAEGLFGAGKGAANFAYLTVSTGVGGGVVLAGQLVQSTNGLAGHLGIVSSPFGQDLCGSGRTGTVESVASGRAIAAAAGLPDARTAFATGTEPALRAIDRSANAIARLCGDLTAIFGLDRVAIGGSVGLAEGYLARVHAHLAEEPPLFRVPVVSATLGQDSALIGALCFGVHPS